MIRYMFIFMNSFSANTTITLTPFLLVVKLFDLEVT